MARPHGPLALVHWLPLPARTPDLESHFNQDQFSPLSHLLLIRDLCSFSFFVSLRIGPHPVDAVVMAPNRGSFWAQALPLAAVVLLLAGLAEASVGDKLPEFKQCLDVFDTTAPINIQSTN